MSHYLWRRSHDLDGLGDLSGFLFGLDRTGLFVLLGGGGHAIFIVASTWSLLAAPPSRRFINSVLIGHCSVSFVVPLALLAFALTGYMSYPIMVPIFFGGILDVPLLCLSLSMKNKPVHSRLECAMVALSVPATLLAPAALSFAAIPFVAWHALRTADGKPLCLQIPSTSHSYKPVTHWIELSGLEMHGLSYPKRPQLQAVLVVKLKDTPVFYNWSYRNLKFMPLSQEEFRWFDDQPACTPVPVFFGRLS